MLPKNQLPSEPTMALIGLTVQLFNLGWIIFLAYRFHWLIAVITVIFIVLNHLHGSMMSMHEMTKRIDKEMKEIQQVMDSIKSRANDGR